MAAILTNGILKIPHRASHAPRVFQEKIFVRGGPAAISSILLPLLLPPRRSSLGRYYWDVRAKTAPT
jgi:hypothetical protein